MHAPPARSACPPNSSIACSRGESPIRVWREHRKMTLDQLGAAAGLSKGYLADLETGKRAGPVETLQAIARALGVGLDGLTAAKASG
jgi:transcriptional regulator with XRE-family HTH domain